MTISYSATAPKDLATYVSDLKEDSSFVEEGEGLEGLNELVYRNSMADDLIATIANFSNPANFDAFKQFAQQLESGLQSNFDVVMAVSFHLTQGAPKYQTDGFDSNSLADHMPALISGVECVLNITNTIPGSGSGWLGTSADWGYAKSYIQAIPANAHEKAKHAAIKTLLQSLYVSMKGAEHQTHIQSEVLRDAPILSDIGSSLQASINVHTSASAEAVILRVTGSQGLHVDGTKARATITDIGAASNRIPGAEMPTIIESEQPTAVLLKNSEKANWPSIIPYSGEISFTPSSNSNLFFGGAKTAVYQASLDQVRAGLTGKLNTKSDLVKYGIIAPESEIGDDDVADVISRIKVLREGVTYSVSMTIDNVNVNALLTTTAVAASSELGDDVGTDAGGNKITVKDGDSPDVQTVLISSGFDNAITFDIKASAIASQKTVAVSVLQGSGEKTIACIPKNTLDMGASLCKTPLQKHTNTKILTADHPTQVTSTAILWASLVSFTAEPVDSDVSSGTFYGSIPSSFEKGATADIIVDLDNSTYTLNGGVAGSGMIPDDVHEVELSTGGTDSTKAVFNITIVKVGGKLSLDNSSLPSALTTALGVEANEGDSGTLDYDGKAIYDWSVKAGESGGPRTVELTEKDTVYTWDVAAGEDLSLTPTGASDNGAITFQPTAAQVIVPKATDYILSSDVESSSVVGHSIVVYSMRTGQTTRFANDQTDNTLASGLYIDYLLSPSSVSGAFQTKMEAFLSKSSKDVYLSLLGAGSARLASAQGKFEISKSSNQQVMAQIGSNVISETQNYVLVRSQIDKLSNTDSQSIKYETALYLSDEDGWSTAPQLLESALVSVGRSVSVGPTLSPEYYNNATQLRFHRQSLMPSISNTFELIAGEVYATASVIPAIFNPGTGSGCVLGIEHEQMYVRKLSVADNQIDKVDLNQQSRYIVNYNEAQWVKLPRRSAAEEADFGASKDPNVRQMLEVGSGQLIEHPVEVQAAYLRAATAVSYIIATGTDVQGIWKAGTVDLLSDIGVAAAYKDDSNNPSAAKLTVTITGSGNPSFALQTAHRGWGFTANRQYKVTQNNDGEIATAMVKVTSVRDSSVVQGRVNPYADMKQEKVDSSQAVIDDITNTEEDVSNAKRTSYQSYLKKLDEKSTAETALAALNAAETAAEIVVNGDGSSTPGTKQESADAALNLQAKTQALATAASNLASIADSEDQANTRQQAYNKAKADFDQAAANLAAATQPTEDATGQTWTGLNTKKSQKISKTAEQNEFQSLHNSIPNPGALTSDFQGSGDSLSVTQQMVKAQAKAKVDALTLEINALNSDIATLQTAFDTALAQYNALQSSKTQAETALAAVQIYQTIEATYATAKEALEQATTNKASAETAAADKSQENSEAEAAVVQATKDVSEKSAEITTIVNEASAALLASGQAAAASDLAYWKSVQSNNGKDGDGMYLLFKTQIIARNNSANTDIGGQQYLPASVKDSWFKGMRYLIDLKTQTENDDDSPEKTALLADIRTAMEMIQQVSHTYTTFPAPESAGQISVPGLTAYIAPQKDFGVYSSKLSTFSHADMKADEDSESSHNLSHKISLCNLLLRNSSSLPLNLSLRVSVSGVANSNVDVAAIEILGDKWSESSSSSQNRVRSGNHKIGYQANNNLLEIHKTFTDNAPTVPSGAARQTCLNALQSACVTSSVKFLTTDKSNAKTLYVNASRPSYNRVADALSQTTSSNTCRTGDLPALKAVLDAVSLSATQKMNSTSVACSTTMPDLSAYRPGLEFVSGSTGVTKESTGTNGASFSSTDLPGGQPGGFANDDDLDDVSGEDLTTAGVTALRGVITRFKYSGSVKSKSADIVKLNYSSVSAPTGFSYSGDSLSTSFATSYSNSVFSFQSIDEDNKPSGTAVLNLLDSDDKIDLASATLGFASNKITMDVPASFLAGAQASQDLQNAAIASLGNSSAIVQLQLGSVSQAAQNITSPASVVYGSGIITVTFDTTTMDASAGAAGVSGKATITNLDLDNGSDTLYSLSTDVVSTAVNTIPQYTTHTGVKTGFNVQGIPLVSTSVPSTSSSQSVTVNVAKGQLDQLKYHADSRDAGMKLVVNQSSPEDDAVTEIANLTVPSDYYTRGDDKVSFTAADPSGAASLVLPASVVDGDDSTNSKLSLALTMGGRAMTARSQVAEFSFDVLSTFNVADNDASAGASKAFKVMKGAKCSISVPAFTSKSPPQMEGLDSAEILTEGKKMMKNLSTLGDATASLTQIKSILGAAFGSTVMGTAAVTGVHMEIVYDDDSSKTETLSDVRDDNDRTLSNSAGTKNMKYRFKLFNSDYNSVDKVSEWSPYSDTIYFLCAKREISQITLEQQALPAISPGNMSELRSSQLTAESPRFIVETSQESQIVARGTRGVNVKTVIGSSEPAQSDPALNKLNFFPVTYVSSCTVKYANAQGAGADANEATETLSNSTAGFSAARTNLRTVLGGKGDGQANKASSGKSILDVWIGNDLSLDPAKIQAGSTDLVGTGASGVTMDGLVYGWTYTFKIDGKYNFDLNGLKTQLGGGYDNLTLPTYPANYSKNVQKTISGVLDAEFIDLVASTEKDASNEITVSDGNTVKTDDMQYVTSARVAENPIQSSFLLFSRTGSGSEQILFAKQSKLIRVLEKAVGTGGVASSCVVKNVGDAHKAVPSEMVLHTAPISDPATFTLDLLKQYMLPMKTFINFRLTQMGLATQTERNAMMEASQLLDDTKLGVLYGLVTAGGQPFNQDNIKNAAAGRASAAATADGAAKILAMAQEEALEAMADVMVVPGTSNKTPAMGAIFVATDGPTAEAVVQGTGGNEASSSYPARQVGNATRMGANGRVSGGRQIA